MFGPALVPLAQSLGLAVGFFGVIWLVSLSRRDASLVDRFWGMGFVLLAWYFWYASGRRHILSPILVTLWGLRLSVYIAWRNWGRGEDYRYQAMRAKHGDRFASVSLATVFLLQAVLLWGIATPLFATQLAEHDATLEVLGIGCWLVGVLFESVGDWQLARFKADPDHHGKVMDQGLWRYTRHPNYFGDMMVWWGYFAFAAAAGGWMTIYAPIAMSLLLMRVSGVVLLEKKLKETKPQYRHYIERTNAFFPGPPRKVARSEAR